MKPVPAIIETDIDHLRDARRALARLRTAEEQEQKAENKLADRREETARMRLALGRVLMRARAAWPARGPKAKGWGEYLATLGIPQSTAYELMRLAGYVAEHEVSSPNGVGDEIPSRREIMASGRDEDPDAPVLHWQRDGDAVIGEPEVEVDRDTWCTPKWITDALGRVDLDPCANERSHVQADTTFRLDEDQDGLELVAQGHVPAEWRVFLNPPYSNVMPWVKGYARTRFCFLLKFDPSTKWFAELYANTALICIPKGTRVQFEAPEGVPPEKSQANQFPHALFFAHAEDATAAIRELCFCWLTKPAAI